MIDFHSHILPGIDDGSKDEEESVKMLQAMAAQGIDTVCATSHFYLDRRSPHSFLKRRQEAYERLRACLPAGAPEIRLGAEVLYFPGIGHLEELEDLCLEGTNLLLLEMPFTRWSEHMIQEVKELAYSGRVTILLAHIERSYRSQRRTVWDELIDSGVLMQANADFFLRRFTRRKALKLLQEGKIHLLGTDAHNTGDRSPRMGEAVSFISERLGEEYLWEIDALGRSILAG